jgi:hypothetical protein
MSDSPLFDDTRKALAFALNAHRSATPPRPAASVAMATTPGKKPRKPRTKKERLAAEEAQREQQDAAFRAMVRVAFSGPRAPRTAERDRAAQAGLILAEFAKLDAAHRAVLSGRLVVSHEPCACRRPCCSGQAVNLRWTVAVAEVCALLKESADLLKVPGKRGLSTLPGLRRVVVEAYLRGLECTVVNLAAQAGVSTVTAAKHRAAITEWLEETENEAWAQAALLLDRAGITGAFADY